MHLTIPGQVISKKNSKVIVCRGRFPRVLPSSAFQKWHQRAQNALGRLQRVEDVQCVEITFYAATARKYDLSNHAESVMDLLVDCGVLEDDNWSVVPELRIIHGGKDAQNPRAEVIIHTK